MITNDALSHPGATSDYLTFAMSPLKLRLDDGLLKEGKYLFGDCAYTNTDCMVTPFCSTGGSAKHDAFNFFHSQLRINVECAFGMLVNRWTILQRPLPQAMYIHKQTALTMCLCKLHNFLINVSLEEPLSDNVIECHTRSRCVNLERQNNSVNTDVPLPIELIDGSKNPDDVAPQELRSVECREQRDKLLLPRTELFESIMDQRLRHPTPKRWL